MPNFPELAIQAGLACSGCGVSLAEIANFRIGEHGEKLCLGCYQPFRAREMSYLVRKRWSEATRSVIMTPDATQNANPDEDSDRTPAQDAAGPARGSSAPCVGVRDLRTEASDSAGPDGLRVGRSGVDGRQDVV